MKRISEYTLDIESAIRELDIESRRPEGLYAPIGYAMEAGGKRLRPVIALMAADAFGGNLGEVMPAALALEFFHNFTLLHDDVMDNSSIRRNRPTVVSKYGKDAAILSGDAMMGIAEELLLKVSGERLKRVMEVFNRMSREVYEGQSLDMEFESRDDVSIKEYMEMIRLKTGALLGASAEIGAIIAGEDEKVSGMMREYGENLGIAFQIEDDWLDTFGDSATFGKPIGGDINQNKKTYLLLSALSKNNEDSEALRVAMELPEGDIRVKTVTRIYERMKISEEARKSSLHYSALALKAAKKTGLPEDKLESFKYLLDRLTGRHK